MGWNDHVSLCETECLSCGVTAQWEYWDEIAIQRYSGSLGEKLGHDAGQSGRCPSCGSPDGQIVDDEEDYAEFLEDWAHAREVSMPLILTMPYEFNIGDTAVCKINFEPATVTWRDTGTLVIHRPNEPDNAREILELLVDECGEPPVKCYRFICASEGSPDGAKDD